MCKKLIYIFMFLAVLTSLGAANWAQEYYADVPPVKIKEPLGVMVGSLNPENPVITISIHDIGLYTGHICPGVAVGFKATALALDALYGDATPVRGKIRIATNTPSDLLDVVSYITGARAFYGRDEVNHNDIVVDKTLGEKPGIVIMIFQRKDTGKMVKVVFNKAKLFNPKEMKKMEQLKEKVIKGKAAKREEMMMRTNLQEKVKQILFNLPEGVITVKTIKDYNFPEMK
ncbi:MAG: hypothetical protein GWP03_04770 [Proteobacteria bacterium]|nr:hypothetical protein [Pseudomonadota bacterium]